MIGILVIIKRKKNQTTRLTEAVLKNVLKECEQKMKAAHPAYFHTSTSFNVFVHAHNSTSTTSFVFPIKLASPPSAYKEYSNN